MTLTHSLWWSAVGCTMLHFLWVGALIGLLSIVGRQLLRATPVSTRYSFTVSCLLLLVVAPVILVVHISDRMQQDPAVSTPLQADDPMTPDDLEALRQAAARSASGAEAAASPRPGNAVAQDSSWPLIIVTAASSSFPWIWIIGSTLCLIGLLTGWTGMHRIRRTLRPLSESGRPAAMLRELARDLRVRNIGVAVTDHAASPSLVGMLHPVILLPRAALSRWNDDQLRMVLLHELWHVRRRDHLVNVLQRFVESLLFFHPAVWWVSARARTDREYCCDAAVLDHLRRPLAYAEMLAALAGARRAPGRLTVAMGEHNLVARIRKVLEHDPPQRRRLPAAAAVMFLATGTWALAYASLAHPDWVVVPPLPGASQNQTGETPPRELPVASPQESPAPGSAVSMPKPEAFVREAAGLHDSVTLQLVDERGQPVVGAQLGVRPRWDHTISDFRSEVGDSFSNAEGIVRITSKGLLKPAAGCDPSVPCLLFHKDRWLAGTIALTLATDWGKTFVVTMKPVVHVTLELRSNPLEERGRPMEWSKAFIRLPGNSISYLLRDTREAPYRFEYYLPPGDYEVVAFGGIGSNRETVVIVRAFTVGDDETSMDLGQIQLAEQSRPVGFVGGWGGRSEATGP